MKDALLYMVTHLVDHPDQVSIEEESVDGVVTFHVAVAKEDVGKVIGKQGRIIRSLRNVMKIPSTKEETRINIVLLS